MYIVYMLTSIRFLCSQVQGTINMSQSFHVMLNETKLASFQSPIDFQLSSYETTKNCMAQFALNTFFVLLNSSHTNSFDTESILRLRIIVIIIIIVIFTRLIFNPIPSRIVKP
uniref:Putative ovule protein n=1 Tax=Solanum chacoense TaxID=4108 RepID=A0A0V0GYZ7_SOLCH